MVENWDILSENVEHKTYEDIVALLTVHDIQLIVFVLEALYSLSELGEEPSTHISRVKSSIGKFVLKYRSCIVPFSVVKHETRHSTIDAVILN